LVEFGFNSETYGELNMAKAKKTTKRAKKVTSKKASKLKVKPGITIRRGKKAAKPKNSVGVLLGKVESKHTPEQDPRDEFLKDYLPEEPETPSQTLTIREQVLSTAQSLVSTDREAAYGDPARNFACAADLKGVFWNYFYGMNPEMGTPRDVRRGRNSAFGHAVDLILTNIARWATAPDSAPQPDRSIDVAGYAALAQEVATRDKPLEGIQFKERF
jgi:hypothetical protein